MKKHFFTFLFLLLLPALLQARPEYSALTGNRCISCHVNVQGGAVRNLLGSYAASDLSIFNLEDTGAGETFKKINDYHSFWEDRILWGFDYRLQSAKLGGPVHSEREIFSMQAAPYLVINPFKWLTLQGQYNFVEALYPAQKSWSASVIINPSYELPQLRIGFFQPSIGLRHDDHTVLIRQTAGLRRANPVIPPDYAELGAEASYIAFKFLNITAGIFTAESMSENIVFNSQGQPLSLIPDDKTAQLVKAVYMPRFFGNMLNVQIGGTYFWGGDFSISDGFLMLGWTDRISFIAEIMMSNKANIRETSNYLLELMYQLHPALKPYIRYESASTDDLTGASKITYEAKQYVFGVNFYPIPYVELRPEYRIYDREAAEGHSAQWTLQLHLYY